MSAALEVIFGPPGTGKTTELARLVSEYVADDGSDSVLLCAYTRTAAQELVGRGMEVNGRQIGTLHALCFHALDRPPIAEAHYKDWNATHAIYQLSAPQSMLMHELGESPKLLGDTCLNELNILRHRRISPLRWPTTVRMFAQAWNGWKADEGYCDFTDLLEKALTVLPVAPGNPLTLVVDEAQDLSLLQWAVLQQWARHASRFLAAGDDEQCLYRWCGADFTPLLAAASRRVLGQSYRVPRSHQALAMQHSQRIRHRERKIWEPQDIDGVLQQDNHDWHAGAYWARQAQQWLEACPWATITYLAPCSYMLSPLIAALREAGVPFGNRWRKQRHDWNPLLPPARGTGMVQRILDFLRTEERLWTWEELAAWVPYLLRTEGVLRHGAKATIALRAEEQGSCTLAELRSLFLDHALDGALRGGLDWLEAHTLQSHKHALAYPCRVYRRHGRAALVEEPRIRLGTGHSFKGTESDIVVQFMDLSRSQEVALCRGGAEADDVYRMLYVAATRSRHTMILAGPHQHYIGAVRWQRPAPTAFDAIDMPQSLDDDDSIAF